MVDNIKDEIENSIIDSINSNVVGRLIIFKPEKNNLGADLAVERRAKYKEKEVYFKINSLVGPTEDDNFIQDFLQEGFKSAKNFYLIFVYFDEIRQKINDYVWLIPSIQFKEIAQVVESPDGKKLLRFEASLNISNKNHYSKFIIKTQELGKTILNALSKGERFEFNTINFEGENKINLENLKEFLCNARENTYAADAIPVDNPRLLESKQLEFQKGEYFYRDIYFLGNRKFIGQEIIYYNSKPIWGMNYVGDVIGKIETVFLKESLFRLSEKCRLGNNCEYEKKEFKYQDQGQGNFEEFSGIETIFLDGKKIYNLSYKGGQI